MGASSGQSVVWCGIMSRLLIKSSLWDLPRSPSAFSALRTCRSTILTKDIVSISVGKSLYFKPGLSQWSLTLNSMSFNNINIPCAAAQVFTPLVMSHRAWHNLFNPITHQQGHLTSTLPHTHISLVTPFMKTISQPEPFQHADNHIPQIVLTLSQLARGSRPEMSSAVMSWPNGVGEMATYIMALWHGTASETVHRVPKQNKVSGRYRVSGWATCCLYRSISASTLSPRCSICSGLWHTVPECSTVSSLVYITTGLSAQRKPSTHRRKQVTSSLPVPSSLLLLPRSLSE